MSVFVEFSYAGADTSSGPVKVLKRIINGTNCLAEINECDQGTKTRHGKQIHINLKRT